MLYVVQRSMNYNGEEASAESNDGICVVGHEKGGAVVVPTGTSAIYMMLYVMLGIVRHTS
jgi:hypothetical protein